MNIQNMVNNREGLLCAQSEDSGILVQHRTEPRINLREFGILPFQTERLNTVQLGALKEKSAIEVRTKENIKNNRLTQFVQYEKQPANHILHFGSIKLGKPKNNPDSDLQYLTSPILGSAKNNHSSLRRTVNYSVKLLAQCYSEHQGNISLMIRLPDNIQLVGLAQSEEYCSKRSQPLGVMPRDFNSFLSIRLIQVAKDKSPSLEACSSSCALNCSGRRIWYCGDFFNSCIDMCNYPLLALLYGSDKCNYFITIKQRSPVVLPTHTEPLTTNDRSCIEVAMYKYTFLIGKGKTRLSEINPIRLISVLAKSENEARLLAGNRHLVFVARQGVAHA